ncbi:MAG: hypothetical protein WCV00_07290 [Verrucomicrobiia bacterium]|jgi:hypothetical protein
MTAAAAELPGLDDGFLHRIAVNDLRGNAVLTIDLNHLFIHWRAGCPRSQAMQCEAQTMNDSQPELVFQLSVQN